MARPRKLFSYVVHHDFGLSPNPSGGYCTLAFCKYREKPEQNANIVETAEVGDWVVGSSGKSKLSLGKHGHLIYAMEVTEKLAIRDYLRDVRFKGRAGNLQKPETRTDMFALVSDHFYYFGKNAYPLAKRHRDHSLEKRGPWHRCDFSQDFIVDFVRWVTQLPKGKTGEPCKAPPTAQTLPLNLPSKSAVTHANPRRTRQKC